MQREFRLLILFQVPYTGALTSSPGLAAAIEATNKNPMISIGHAIAYPIGVIVVILFVQLVPDTYLKSM